jgi:hypothetical protein
MFIELSIINDAEQEQSQVYNLFNAWMYVFFTASLLSATPTLIKTALPAIAKIHLAVISGVFLLFLIIYGISGTKDFSEIYLLSVPLGVLLLSYSYDLSEKAMAVFLLFFCCGTVAMGLWKTFYNIGGFVILERYNFGAKNQTTPILSSAIIILLFFFFNRIIKGKFFQFFLPGCILCLFYMLLVARGRTAIIATIVTSLAIVLFYSKRSANKYFFLMIILIVFILGGASLIYDSFFVNYDVGDLNSISAGRMDGYTDGLNLWYDNLWWGKLFSQKELVSHPHNFILNEVVMHGLIGCLMPVSLYVAYLYFLSGRMIFYRKQNRNIADLGFLLMFTPFITSLSEYSFPFGPGTSQVINFFLLGYLLKQEQKRSIA